MQNLAIEIKGLNKSYKVAKKSQKKIALSDFSLDIPAGSFFGLLGPNGAGKSTLINILAGLIKKDDGLVKIADIDIDKDQKKSKFKIGIVPQELVIDPFFTVEETLDIYAGYFGISKKERRTHEIIEALGLQDKAKSKPRSLSGGMRRRLLIAKALVHDPEIIVLDEPTAGVDVDLRSQLWEYVKKLNAQGKTILLTTHYLEEAEELCDKIAIINRGKLIANEDKSKLMSVLGDKELIIDLSKKIDDLEMLRRDLNLEASQKGNQLSIIYDPSKINIMNIFQYINKLNNIDICDISTRQPDLEEIFKHLIKK